VSDWQPIETAPKDGSWFITINASADGEYEVARYAPNTWPIYIPLKNGNYSRVDRVISEFTSDNFGRASHWMPLPPPPKDIQGDPS
jgi:hypothetical protein